MIGLKLDEAKGTFFDAPKVIRSVDAATRRVLSKFGAYVRTAARSSIRKRKATSVPGSPPSSHTGLLRQFIFFGYDAANRSVVIGPTRLNSTSGTAPETLEYGGSAKIVRRQRGGKRVVSTANIAARPFMHPALNKELPKLPPMWANSVKP
jgi:hypothetical protein